MAKKCDLTGTGAMSGNNVSHANNRTRRRFLPNLDVYKRQVMCRFVSHHPAAAVNIKHHRQGIVNIRRSDNCLLYTSIIWKLSASFFGESYSTETILATVMF